MSDDFLIGFRKPPRREFADTLYKRISQQNETRALGFSTPIVRRLALSFAVASVAFAVLLAISPDVRAQVGEIIQKIIVIEPSQSSSLRIVVERANFPIWVYDDGELVRVSDLAEGKDYYSIFLEYRLTDGRRFFVRESKSLPHLHNWDEEVSRVIDENVEVNGQRAVLYLDKLTRVVNSGYQIEWFGPNLHWHADETDLTLNPRIDNTFTRDEIIGIARSLRQVSK